MPTKLSVYNGALRHLGQRRLASLSEDNTTRRELDEAWDSVVETCLGEGFWNFAMRTVEIPASSDLETAFGYNDVFVKPDDWVRTYQTSFSESFQPPLEDYEDEADYWYANGDPLYVRYVSSGADLGGNTNLWARAFSNYVEASLAFAVCRSVTGADPASIQKEVKRLLLNARSKDAMNEGVGQFPEGSWIQARRGGNWGGRARWNGKWR